MLLNFLDLSVKIENFIILKMFKFLWFYSLNDGFYSDDMYYNFISVLIKFLRGSDENAFIYYLVCLIVGGENLEFIVRRLVIFVSEDIGNVNLNVFNLAFFCLFLVK